MHVLHGAANVKKSQTFQRLVIKSRVRSDSNFSMSSFLMNLNVAPSSWIPGHCFTGTKMKPMTSCGLISLTFNPEIQHPCKLQNTFFSTFFHQKPTSCYAALRQPPPLAPPSPVPAYVLLLTSTSSQPDSHAVHLPRGLFFFCMSSARASIGPPSPGFMVPPTAQSWKHLQRLQLNRA